MITLGSYGKDIITGFKGLVMARTDYLTGCSQILLTPTKLTKEGKRPDGEWFDEQRVVVDDSKQPIVLDNKDPGADEREAPKK